MRQLFTLASSVALDTTKLSQKSASNGSNADISAFLDNRPIIRWRGKQSSLQVPHSDLPHAGQPGLGANHSAVLFQSARLWVISGDAPLVTTQPDAKKTFLVTYMAGNPQTRHSDNIIASSEDEAKSIVRGHYRHAKIITIERK